MLNDIVSADKFHIFSESYDHFFLLNEVKFGIKTSNLIEKNFCLAEIDLSFAEKTTVNAPG